MKYIKLLLIVGLVTGFGCSSDDSGNNNNNNNNNNNSATTNIPDPVFEQALIDLGFDDALDGVVLTNSIELVVDLVLNDLGISNLSGLEDFTALTNLWVNDNDLNSLNVSQNLNLKFIFAERNSLTQINVSSLFDLEKLALDGNAMSSIDVSANFNLQQLTVSNNQLGNIDVSNNQELNVLNVIGNPLTCIRVNAQQFTDIPAQWQKDAEDEYSLTCN